MLCPKCNSKIINNCCIKCGYMLNGNYVGKVSKIDKFEDQKLYNNSFDRMQRNKNKFLIFLFGPLYFYYRNHFIFGIIISALDIFISYFICSLTKQFFTLYLYELGQFLISLMFLFKRFLYTIFSNTICLKLDNIKIKKIKYNKNNYKNILINHKDKSLIIFIIGLIFNLLLFIILYTDIIF
ncbi:MAG: hypothetical protein NC181_03420 [Clostridium sp.]|nr:hypothetical protein [Clostridium sp.]MCM1444340.1 hypothetical protein [Candidatus Amulumruptor caecigallinarius]